MQSNLTTFQGGDNWHNIEGVPSAHDPKRMFYPHMKEGRWVCDSSTGPCDHFRRWKTPCRHILQKKYNNIEDLWKHICELTIDARSMRDETCMSFDEVVTIVEFYRSPEINRLCTLLMNIAVLRGKVTSDDLHNATGEQYRDDKIVGVAVGSLLRSKLIECIGRKKTERKCAHGRSIGVYQLTEQGYKVLEARRPEKALGVR